MRKRKQTKAETSAALKSYLVNRLAERFFDGTDEPKHRRAVELWARHFGDLKGG